MLTSKQTKCIGLMVAGNMTEKQIAEEIHVTPATICNWKKNEEFMAERNKALKVSIKDAASNAFKTEQKLLGARSEMVRLMAAKDILDRAGFKPDESVNLAVEPISIINDLDEDQ